ncbi:hypothetical protein RB620_19810 [Paenibacillus sp. LHD-117]|uniref:hypothetical protein n=1 Tax=Paenibacillus sp. LHD-117 TaxID=3071412 RepID=UPI0027E17E1A|nr:hypothetical protein [Paenibacillus sp. LHD-117]MDQ6421676.1 hypothetical protein [Paenibacillus sp. LHD-117]
MKKMGFLDRAIFILGLTLAGVIAFVLVAGVIVAMLKLYLESKPRRVKVNAVTMRNEKATAKREKDSEDRRSTEREELPDNTDPDNSGT